jgi:hypothetical protein
VGKRVLYESKAQVSPSAQRLLANRKVDSVPLGSESTDVVLLVSRGQDGLFRWLEQMRSVLGAQENHRKVCKSADESRRSRRMKTCS